MKLGAIVIDSNISNQLADFYKNLLKWEKIVYDADWIIVQSKNGEGTPLVFQHNDNYQRPEWPEQEFKQQQMLHLDFYVDNVEASVSHALSCGAIKSEKQFSKDWQVLLDPAGHPFCILPNVDPNQ